MIIRIIHDSANVTTQPRVVRVVRVYNTRMPAGITDAEFTQKGGILVGSGAGTHIEQAPGSDGQFVQYDSTQPGGVKAAMPSIEIQDSTNYLLNGGFNFAQRQAPATLTTIATHTYGPDRWMSEVATASLQYQRGDGAAESGLTSPYFGTYKKITNAGKFLVCQPLEYLDSLKFRGKTVNFQLQMKASKAQTIKIAIVEIQAAGTADDPPTIAAAWGADTTDPTLGANLATIAAPVSCSVTTAWQTFQFTATFPADSKNLIVMIWTDAAFAANDTLSLAEGGLYFGSTQRSWTPRPISHELKMVKRYYRKTYSLDVAPGTASADGYAQGVGDNTTDCFVYAAFDEMRATPTVAIYSFAGTASKISNTAGADVGTSFTAVRTSQAVSRVTDTGAGLTAGTRYIFHFTAEAEIL